MFWLLRLSPKFVGVPEDSKFSLLGVWVSSSQLPQTGVATMSIITCFYLFCIICRSSFIYIVPSLCTLFVVFINTTLFWKDNFLTLITFKHHVHDIYKVCNCLHHVHFNLICELVFIFEIVQLLVKNRFQIFLSFLLHSWSCLSHSCALTCNQWTPLTIVCLVLLF